MTEITENVTITLQKYDDLQSKIHRLENEARDFRRLFEIKETAAGFYAVVRAEQLQSWAKKNISKHTGFLSYKSVSYLMIIKEDSK